MSSGGSPNLVLELHRCWSHYLPAVLLLVVAWSLPWLAGSWSLLARLLCVTMASSLAIASLWRSGLLRPARQLSKLSWNHEQSWQLQFGATQPVAARLLGRSWCTSWAICLKFKTDSGERYQLLLWRNQLSRQAWHQWRLRLRQEGRQQAEQLADNLDNNLKIEVTP